MTRPPDADPLRSLAEMSAAMHHGRDAFDQRLDELGGGYPSAGGSGATRTASEGGPTAAQAMTHIPGGVLDKQGRPVPVRSDVAELERKAWERELHKALEHASAMWARYQRIVNVRLGVEKLTDPGCELCAQVTEGHCDRCNALTAPHWCAARYTIDHTEPAKRKGQTPTTRKLALCSSCYSFQRPDQAGRLPDHGDVLDHAEGRRRRWKAS